MKQEIVLFDKDKEYLAKFLVFFKAYMGDKLSIQGFSEEVTCCQYIQNQEVTLLLTHERDYRINFKEFPVSKTMVFSDEDLVKEMNGIRVVYKYQKAEAIIRCILDYCATCYAEICTVTSTVCEHTELIGIYSPVKRCGKTAFALEYARRLAESKKVLVISMEEYASACQQEAWKYDLEDLIYFYLQNGNGFELKLRAVSQVYQTFEWIPPVKVADELREITFEQWRCFIEKIRSCGVYDIIIVDISDAIKNIMQILSLCDFVIMPYVSDSVSNQKRVGFEEMLNQKFGEDWTRIYPVSLDDVVQTVFNAARLEEKVKEFVEMKENAGVE